VAVDYRLAPLPQAFTVGCDLPPGVWAEVPEGEPLAWEAGGAGTRRRASSPERRFTVHVGIGAPPPGPGAIDLRTTGTAARS